MVFTARRCLNFSPKDLTHSSTCYSYQEIFIGIFSRLVWCQRLQFPAGWYSNRINGFPSKVMNPALVDGYEFTGFVWILSFQGDRRTPHNIPGKFIHGSEILVKWQCRVGIGGICLWNGSGERQNQDRLLHFRESKAMPCPSSALICRLPVSTVAWKVRMKSAWRSVYLGPFKLPVPSNPMALGSTSFVGVPGFFPIQRL